MEGFGDRLIILGAIAQDGCWNAPIINYPSVRLATQKIDIAANAPQPGW